MEYTPGPWKRSFDGSKWWIYTKNNDEIHPHISHIINIAQCVGPKDRINSFLIAAAPELLIILESLLNRWDGHSFDGDPETWRKQALAAIKKARGEE